ncbi:YebC/PmpR family DNA-binding transcriptional regulator, partial [SCandidatus Aminicenantes bacterium Aminicenantia_JdfR_composite]|nr:YebC/PmpR family DNA-binding transcriptional regulator [SCandidatus Aminicenantes bacterium Aminicenantia_JdfR_composite]
PEANPRHRKAIEDAKSVNMPAENIKRAIQRGTGEIEGAQYEEVFYEGYGPGGVAIFVEALTDNKNRTVAELRHIFTKYGGRLGEPGCVSWLFSRKGYIVIEKSKVSEDKLLEIILESGAEDMRDDGSNWEVFTPPEKFDSVVDAIKRNNISIATSSLAFIPQNYVKLQGKEAEQLLKLLSALEDHDDVKKVWSNFDIEEEEISRFAANE